MKYGVALLLACAALPARAALECRAAWIREPPPRAAVLAGYAQLHNTGTAPLVIADVKAAGFERAEIHRTEIKNGMARMVSIDDLTIAPNATEALEPGGMHLMLFKPRHALRAGEKVSWYFTTNQGPQRCTAMVEK